MPIKLPKGFPRRKSSGNVLDEIQNDQSPNNRDSVSSFRVLARPHSSGKTLDAGTGLRPGLMPGGPQSQSQLRVQPKPSFEDDNEELFSVVRNDATNRGSGGTSNSLSTNQYDSGASSTRLSISSTNPSSVDARSDRNINPASSHRDYEDAHPLPQPPIQASKANFLKHAGRTFSFGINRNASRETNELPPAPPAERSRRGTNTTARERAMTVSSVTTATPPRLDDSSFSIKESDDEFGNMFANLESKPGRDNHTSMHPAPLRAARAAPPQPIHVNNGVHVEGSPYSWNSQNSKDGLITSPSPSRTVTQGNSQHSTIRNIGMHSRRSNTSEEDNLFGNSPVHRSPEQVLARPAHSPSSRPPPTSFPAAVMNRARALSNAAASARSHRSNSSDYDMPRVDPTLLANAQLASMYEEKQMSPNTAQNNKIMTPAEFERYKQHKEDTRRYNKVFGKADSDEGSGDDYDDEEDDDQEREKQAVKQRKKQEAHLAVYRQQMMKVTGDTPNLEQHRPEQRPDTSMSGYQMGNSSQLNMATAERRMSSITLDGKHAAVGIGKLPMEDEDEDEDVPLGILAAHGFPNKNRPPTRLATSSSNTNLRNLAQTQGGTSVAGGETSRGGLPAFARNLPPDPYYGASIVQQTDRQPLAMHASASTAHLVTQPQPSGAATAHPLHPAGLVGVIAGEERARALRRGSPNPQPAYDMPLGVPPQQFPQQMGRMPQQMLMPGYPAQGMMAPSPTFSTTEQAQLQMTASMTHMMQMQMQWFQQMTGMMAQQPNMQMPGIGMPGMPGMPGMQGPTGMQGIQGMQGMPQIMHNGVPPTPPSHGDPHLRPQSVPLQGYQGQSHHPRTMSTLSPSMAGWNYSSPAVPQIHHNGASVYAPSIAPSERSNVGLASRYRPVTTVSHEPETPQWVKRASTFTSASFRPWTNENANNRPNLATTTVRTIQPADDDDDEQGWADMKARKEKKQRSWKMRKGGSNTLQELYNAPA